MSNKTKTKCRLVGEDGNVFNLIGIVLKCLQKQGLNKEAKEFSERVMKAGSYDQALQIMMEYVDPT